MKRIFAANIIGIGAVLALGVAASANAAQAPQGLAQVAPTVTLTSDPSASPTPTVTESSSPTPTPTSSDEPTSAVVTADIYFEINYAVDAEDDPLYWEVDGVVVNDEVEMPATNRYFDEGEDDYCTLPSVDIAADLSSVTVTGDDMWCEVQIAYLGITLHGGSFGEVTLGHDGLFQPIEDGDTNPQVQLKGSGGGHGGLSGAVHFAVVDLPTVQEFGTDGTNFEADWLGSGHGIMTGVTGFDFAIAADGAEPVAGDPNFTG